MKKCRILFYNTMWDIPLRLEQHHVGPEFELLSGEEYFETADVVVFHMPTITSLCNKRPGQLWVYWSMECEAHYAWQQAPEILGRFDIMMTYKLDADVRFTYLNYEYGRMLRRAPKPKEGLIDAFISSNFNHSGRVEYLKELMSYLDVHSYGKLFNNSIMENDEGVQSKGRVMAKYKFTIAFENAVVQDYVTEKFYHPLIVGSVPIYLGAPNIDTFAPGDHCYIDVRNYSSVRELADYLLELDHDDHLYQAYFQWKEQPYRDNFELMLEDIKTPPFERLCQVVKERLLHKVTGE